jgi:hypothetical protein
MQAIILESKEIARCLDYKNNLFGEKRCLKFAKIGGKDRNSKD